MHRHTHFHLAADQSQTEARLRSIEAKLDLIIRNQEKSMSSIKDTAAAIVDVATRVKKGNADLITVLTAVRDQNVAAAAKLKELQDQLAAMPQDTAEAESLLESVRTDLTQVATDTENAVKSNNEVPDMPEVQL